MIRRHLRVAVFACGLVAVYAQAAENGGRATPGTAGGSSTRGPAGPTADVLREHSAPLQTGEVRVPKGGLETGEFEPNAGAGFKGQSTPVGTVTAPTSDASRAGNSGATPGAPLASRASRDAGNGDSSAASGRGDRGTSGTDTKNTKGGNTRGDKNRNESSLDPGLRIR